ncbi:enoyl-CoA hydratase/isomerase family protein [Phytohabitans kaempferiae]|uniref:Enoyl-CoA hydratase/isomerase family protein n=1 Tax=Phytohabitans kaempferiae TaxID=1620943 RepID=A0ABV6MFM5_9ACTN
MGVEMTVEGPWAQVTLDWPEKRNALAPPDAVRLAEALVEAGKCAVSAVLLTGNGAFCSGGDLRTFAEIGRGGVPEQIATIVYGKIQAVVRALRDCPVPTIAAVDGAAVGLGMDLALACDMRFVGERGWLRQGWGRAGLIAAGGGGFFLAQHGDTLPWTLLASQERLDSSQAAALGLAEAAPGEAIAAARARAQELAEVPEQALRGYVALHRSVRWPPQSYLDECARRQAELICSEQFGVRAREILGAA